MNDQLVVVVQNLFKSYKLYQSPKHRLMEAIHPFRKKYYRDFHVLNDISFKIKKGESIGILGRNGAGKSTLLKILTGVLIPTSGKIEVKGKISALLELGAGFNPDLSGMENLFFHGAISGLTREEMEEKIPKILIFADIGEYINQPVRSYSSGMFVRLAFSLVANMDSDLLIIDEAMAVGDIFFQQKCWRFIEEFKSQGGTLIVVTHDLGIIQSKCDRAIYITKDRAILDGKPEDISKHYLDDFYLNNPTLLITPSVDTKLWELTNSDEIVSLKSESSPFKAILSKYSKTSDSFGQKGMIIADCYIENLEGMKIYEVLESQRINLCYEIETIKEILSPAFGFMVKNKNGEYVIAESVNGSSIEKRMTLKANSNYKLKFIFNMPLLIRGDYLINIAIAEGEGDQHIQHHWVHDAIHVTVISSRLIQGVIGMPELEITLQGLGENIDAANNS